MQKLPAIFEWQGAFYIINLYDAVLHVGMN